MNRVIIGALLGLAATGVQAQQCVPALSGGTVVDAPQYALAYRFQPAKVAIGRHFSLEIVVCAKAGAGAIDGLQVDAVMPEHRHGMNYRATVQSLGSGRFQVDGLMFHMPGRWDLLFDVSGGGRTERIVHENALR